jgi:hypothetical protein
MKKPAWRRVKNISRLNFSGKALRCCYLGVSYLLLRNRNSYNSSYSIRYYSNTAFHSSLLYAQKCIQENRTRGTSWEIIESPVIVLVFDSFCISICFAFWDDYKFCFNLEGLDKQKSNLSVTKILNYLTSVSGVFLYKHEESIVNPMSKRLRKFKSYISGGNICWKNHDIHENIPGDFFDLLKLICPLTKAKRAN